MSVKAVNKWFSPLLPNTNPMLNLSLETIGSFLLKCQQMATVYSNNGGPIGPSISLQNCLQTNETLPLIKSKRRKWTRNIWGNAAELQRRQLEISANYEAQQK